MANYLYVSESPDGWRNLAVDEYFLDNIQKGEIMLYFYTNANAVIIGRGQNPWAECNLTAMDRDHVQLVRRITGGGAVFHDSGNLNFSFIAGKDIYDVPRQMNLILRAVQSLGIPCEFSGRNDLLADGRKFSGNAFGTRGEVCQHHGTLLIRADMSRLQNYLNVDPRKLKAKGVKSVRSRVCNLSEFVPDLTCERMLAALKAAFRAEYGETTQIGADWLEESAIAPYYEKHSSDAWRLGSTPAFDSEIENRFPWGNVQLLLTLRGGKVQEVRAYSDAIDADLPDELRARLSDADYNPNALADRLAASEKEQIRQMGEYIRKLEL